MPLPPRPAKATPAASFLAGSVSWRGAMSPCPHGYRLPGLVVVWVFLICGEAVRGARRCWDLPTGHRPHVACATLRVSCHCHTALPFKGMLDVSGSRGCSCGSGRRSGVG